MLLSLFHDARNFDCHFNKHSTKPYQITPSRSTPSPSFPPLQIASFHYSSAPESRSVSPVSPFLPFLPSLSVLLLFESSSAPTPTLPNSPPTAPRISLSRGESARSANPPRRPAVRSNRAFQACRRALFAHLSKLSTCVASFPAPPSTPRSSSDAAPRGFGALSRVNRFPRGNLQF